MGRTNVIIDDKLLREARKATGLKTIREIVHEGIKSLTRHRRLQGLLDLYGKVEWEGDLKAERRKWRDFGDIG